MKMKLFLGVILCSLCTCLHLHAFAQSKAITGSVHDDKGNALPGATVQVKDTKVATVTDVNGKFSLQVPNEGKILVFTFIGMQTLEQTIGQKSTFNVVLQTASRNLGDLVVIGYGQQRRQDVNGSVSTIKSSDIANIAQVSVDQMIQGKAAGVTVTQNSGQPGSLTSVRIRGVTSLTMNNEPLYVIDGVQVSGDGRNTSTGGRSVVSGPSTISGGGQTALSPLAALNPNDILSIDILKDASATAIFGSRGSNGVIIITTKKGRTGIGKLTYDGYYGVQQPSKYLDVMNLRQYATLQNEMAKVYGVEPRQEFSDISLLGNGTNWQKEIFRNAPMTSHSLAFSGGKDGVNYYVSAGYLDQQGIVIGSYFKRYSVRANIDGQVNSWLKVGTNVTASRTNENITVNDLKEGIVSLALQQAPDLAVYNMDGSWAGPLAGKDDGEGSENPVAKALSILNGVTRNKIMGNIYADINFSKAFTFHSEVSGDFNFGSNTVFKPTYKWGRYENKNATLYEGRSNSMFWSIRNYLTYNATFNQQHNITAMLGQEAMESSWEGISAMRQGFFTNNIYAIDAGDVAGASNGGYRGSGAQASYYGRLLYAFKDKYGLTATIRADGSSKYDQLAKKQWGYFPSFAASWKLFNEPFMKNVNQYVNNIRLKAGWGIVGNQDVPGFLYGSSLAVNPTGLGAGVSTVRIPNPNLQWESAMQTNLGIDFSLFKDKLNATVEFYNKTSKDFLYQLSLPVVITGGPDYNGGLSNPYVNLGKMNNKGYDITLNYRAIAKGNFTWNTTLTFSQYKNNVKELSATTTDITKTLNSGFLTFPLTRTVQGMPMGMFYGFKTVGIFNDQSKFATLPKQFGVDFGQGPGQNWLGDVQYEDVNGDGKIDEKDRTFIGSPHPKFTYGFMNSFSYKNFDLSVFVQGSYGNKILNLTRVSAGGLQRLYTNQFADVANFYTPENPNTNIPRPRRGDDNPNLFLSDRFLEDGSYLRIQTVNLGYNFSSDLLRKVRISRLKVYGSVQNLYTFTKYTGYDPEVGAYNGDALQLGIDNGRYPSPRTFTFGLNAEF
ncbi:TonB-linked SusC/RagA family outer membrane protein [Chitinophaga skermanii]|uniref:TonB-linked SusC/RagA family outer membrane protein n=1 Tax=Chitinophaga skermanii TaxID=331697 RepID=A0A327QX65_9BACT|nr:TonB-dependent receptor [Chitinophaga skermanii]RAJ08555.1 TonB-linked SusC/RagA family outer membrane protein [Chitinophaga skermanii]